MHPVYYVGSVVKHSGSVWCIRCLRKYGESLAAFVYPNEEDIADYNHDQIVKVLPTPKVSRGVYYFPPDELSAFGSNLR